MNTIDAILPHLNQHIKTIELLIPKKDKRILVSLAKQIHSGVFLTENQANLLVKIINENLTAVRSIFQDIEKVIFENLWSKEFRTVQKVRKISIDSEIPSCFSIEFSFNTRLKEKLTKLLPLADGQVVTKGSKYLFLLYERNIDLIVSNFIKENFEIDSRILNFYREIEKVKSTIIAPFDIFSTTNEQLKRVVETRVGAISNENVLLLHDRKIRHQYQISEKTEINSLTTKIANRSSRRIYVNSREINLLDVITSLKELNRFPLMVVFEGQSSEKDKTILTSVQNSIDTLELGNEVGIYFRYDKENDKSQFNQEIALLGYNKNLSDRTVVAGISNNKLPKFMIKTEWKPQTVITFTNSFRANKSSVYCIDVDLVVYYTGTQPLDETIHALL